MNANYFSFTKRHTFLLLIGTLITLASCKKTDQDNLPNVNVEVNEWVADNMRIYYYWNHEIPSDSRLNFEADPPAFFETILSRNDEFSWIQKADELNEEIQGVTTSTGIDIVLLGYDGGSKVLAVIKYVIPGSPADKENLERGDMFTRVNGKEMTSANYLEVLNPYLTGESFSITLATLTGNQLTTTDKTVSLTSTKVDEPSVHHHSIITSATGKKIGYIFYNRFLNNKVDELYNVFNELKAAGVNDLILDLRYNLGGGIAVSGVLSALIMDNYDNKNVFVKYEYNDLLNQEFDASGQSRDERFRDLFLAFAESAGQAPTEAEIDAAIAPVESKVKGGNLNLPKVYVLATDNSASASELVINNLAPYMDVIHIGGTTIGKNEGSITIEDERKPRQIDWAIQPIIVKLADREGNGDYDNGLMPDIEIDEFDYLPLSPVGSKEDPLIFTALKMIDPAEAATTQALQMSTSRAQTRKAAFSVVEEFNKKNIKSHPVLLDKDQINQTVINHLKTRGSQYQIK